MKNLTKLVGIIAIVAVIGFSMTACELPDKEDKKDDFSLEGKWAHFSVYYHEFTGENFLVAIGNLGSARGTFTHTATHITFNPTHYNSTVNYHNNYDGYDWQEWDTIDIGYVEVFANSWHIDGNPVSYRFEYDFENTLRLYIGDVYYYRYRE